MSSPVRNAGSDIQDTGSDRRKSFQCCGHGNGEPLDNYENLLRFIHILTEDGGLHISQRNLTVSTCGLVPKIYDLAKEKLQMTLALSFTHLMM